jgi:AcrR family transcriptional regulator
VTEIKATAVDLMREQGTTNVRFSDIARAMGLTAPALYRYFPDRDALLTELIADGYRELAATLVVDRSATEASDPRAELAVVAQAFRRWAVDDPSRFTLLFGQPIPGYSAPANGPTVEAAQQAMGNLAAVVLAAAKSGTLKPPLITSVSPAIHAYVEADRAQGGAIQDVPDATHLALLHAWASLHGGVALEAYGHLDFCSLETRDAIFESLIELVVTFLGL